MLFALQLLIVFVAAQQIAKPGGAARPVIAFENIHVVDVKTGELTRNQVIIVENGLITDIGDKGSVSVPDNAAVKDLDGLYVVPGFWDMHVHISRPTLAYSGPMMAMHGVFNVRNMSGDCVGQSCGFRYTADEYREIDTRVRNGALLAPKTISLGSYTVHGPHAAFGDRNYPHEPGFLVPQTPEEAKQLVAYLKNRRVDFLKPYNTLQPKVYETLARESKAGGLPLEGHVPKSLTLMQALKAGQRTIEHARMLPIACSNQSKIYASDYKSWIAGPAHAEGPSLVKYYPQLLEGFDEEACTDVLKVWARTGAYYVPTHLTRRHDIRIFKRPFLTDPRAAYIPDLVINMGWEGEASSYEKTYKESPDLLDASIGFYELGVALTGRAHAAGVKVLVGTDTGDTLIYPGASFHDEMSIYADAGLPPADILKAATIDAARYAGLEGVAGALQAGHAGELVFLKDNPLDDIAHTRSIEALYFQERFYDADARRAVMDNIASRTGGLGQFLTVGWIFQTRLLPALVFGDGADGAFDGADACSGHN
ncbi:MAG: amidohydrolase family protein [Pseudomonadota bacterium]